MRRADRADRASAQVLVVDDEPDIRELLELTLVRMGLDVAAVGTIAEAKERLKSDRYDLCLTDMRLTDGEGLELVRHIAAHAAEVPVAVITAFGSAENAVAALKAGAFDYVSKPVGRDQLRALVRSALSLPERTEAPARDKRLTGRLLGESAPLIHVREMISKLARTQAPVYISGESGTGKELAARLIHENGARRERPFVPVNCGAIPENLMESEFFGYKKGAFTGAAEDREGLFQAAHGGTLFLDEVADLPLAMQVKLLRAIQEKAVRSIGGQQETVVDVRILCATHKDLDAEVAAERFRQDLYYRLNVIELRVPSLRERRDDIELLANNMLKRLAASTGQPPAKLHPQALEALKNYRFPGNVRELENMLERAHTLCENKQIEASDLRLAEGNCNPDGGVPDLTQIDNLEAYLENVERKLILQALEETRWNRTAAAQRLNLSFRSMRYRLKKLGLD